MQTKIQLNSSIAINLQKLVESRLLVQANSGAGKSWALRRILKPLLEAYPCSLTHKELAERAGYIHTGGAFNNPRGRLRSLGLIEYIVEGVRAAELLFIE